MARIGWGFISPLVRLDFSTRDGIHAKGFTGQRYIDQVLWPHLGVDVATSCGRDPLFGEENGPSHNTRAANELRAELYIDFQALPSASFTRSQPDCEYVGGAHVGGDEALLSAGRPRSTTSAALCHTVQMAWDEIPMEKVNKTVLSVLERREAVLVA